MSLQIGDQGSQVRTLQQQLASRGFDPHGADGVFGPATQRALEAFQSATPGLKTDGVAGTKTFQALRNQDSFTPTATARKTTTPQTPRAPQSPRSPSAQTQPAVTGATPTAGGPTAHVNTPWYSQFDGSHGYSPGNASCLPTSRAMARAAGANPTEQQVTGRNMSNYVDSQLAAGKPVLATVRHSGTHSGNHVVVITGKGQDANGPYYTFNDPGTTHREMGVDTNPNNRLRLNPTTGAMTRHGTNPAGPVYQQDYTLQFVRKNA